jgi:drug/metabolite transporter (DMT)-like permease
MVAALVLGCVIEVLVKRLDGAYPIAQVLFFRMAFSLPVLVVAVLVLGRSAARTTAPLRQMGRALIQLVAVGCWFQALPGLALGDATALSFTMPLFLVLLSALLTNERPGPRQWLGVALGFPGIIVMAVPTVASGAGAVTLVLASAALRALSLTQSRGLARKDGIAATVIWFTGTSLAATALALPWAWRTPALADLPALMVIGLAGGVSQFLMIAALSRAPTGQLAALDYLRLPLAALLSWLLFGDVLGPLSLVGAGVILVAAWLAAGVQFGRPAR